MKQTLQHICQHIDRLLQQKERVIVAIDGPCAAGKTTLADQLAHIYDCNLLHMDDFFLQAHQRTPQRYAEAGGNVDYARFYEEVLLPALAGQTIPYRRFDCATFTLMPATQIPHKKLTIIEGTYSQHPYFQDPYDLKIFLDVTQQLQRQRILQRPAFLHQRFFQEWIPLEQAYFTQLRIAERCDLVFPKNP